MQTDENNYKLRALKAAKELRYGAEIIRKIKNAKDDSEIARIMITARENGKNK